MSFGWEWGHANGQIGVEKGLIGGIDMAWEGLHPQLQCEINESMAGVQYARVPLKEILKQLQHRYPMAEGPLRAFGQEINRCLPQTGLPPY